MGHKTSMSVSDSMRLHALIREAEAAVHDPWRRDPWLSRMTATQAFVVCVGAGPWKIGRRRKIQTAALDVVGQSDLVEAVPYYPLAWQTNMVWTLRTFLVVNKTTMTAFCDGLQDPRDLYAACGCPKGTKVLSLFVRDYLELPAFPIDRHVRRLLQKHGLPTKEAAMIALCQELGFDPSYVAQLVVRYGSRDDALNPQDLVPEGSAQAIRVMQEVQAERFKSAMAAWNDAWYGESNARRLFPMTPLDSKGEPPYKKTP